MLRDTLKEYGQSNLVLLSRPDYPEFLEYRLKCCDLPPKNIPEIKLEFWYYDYDFKM
jgi:hypothetical protein